MKGLVLAGGRGTRIAHIIGDIPKPMIEFGGRPFLAILNFILLQKGISEIIFSIGHFSEKIIEYFRNDIYKSSTFFNIEKELLGTGGAIFDAVKNFKIQGNFLACNGDSYNQFDLKQMLNIHESNDNDVTILAKYVSNSSRYGTLDIQNGRVVGFHEKHKSSSGAINSGVYIINPRIFSKFDFPKTFSFETDLLGKYTSELKIGAVESDEYFIDFGIPSDLELARKELPILLAEYAKSFVS